MGSTSGMPSTAERSASRTVDLSAVLGPQALVAWRTASGRNLPHIVYTLIGCPPVDAASYILVRRDSNGGRQVLAIAHTASEAASLNLARIRHDGARLGANEVHVHVLATSESERARVVFDLSAAHLHSGAGGAPN